MNLQRSDDVETAAAAAQTTDAIDHVAVSIRADHDGDDDANSETSSSPAEGIGHRSVAGDTEAKSIPKEEPLSPLSLLSEKGDHGACKSPSCDGKTVPCTSNDSNDSINSSAGGSNNNTNRLSFTPRIEQPTPDRASEVKLYDDQLLHKAVADAGRWSYGIVMVEVWVLNDEGTRLFRPDAGWWIDPVFHDSCGTDCQLCRLVDSNRDDYVAPEPLAAGVGLAGALWAEVRVGGAIGGKQKEETTMAWRDVKALAADPDQPWNPRLHLLAQIGLGWAAAVPFSLHGAKGITIHMARDGVDLKRLRSPNNEAYLLAASGLVGSAYALRGSRRQVVEDRHQELKETVRRVRLKIFHLVKAGRGLSASLYEAKEAKAGLVHEGLAGVAAQQTGTDSETIQEPFCNRLGNYLITVAKKCAGAGVKPPPAFTWKQTALTFFGVFVTFLMITQVNIAFMETNKGSLTLGTFGALAQCQFALSQAPGSQPRNGVLGQVIGISIGLGFSYATSLALWMRQTLAVAFSTAIMAKCGFIHPPAGASSVTFAAGNLGWPALGFMVAGYCVAIPAAALVNNMTLMRQYPTYYGWEGLAHQIRKILFPSKDEEEEKKLM